MKCVTLTLCSKSLGIAVRSLNFYEPRYDRNYKAQNYRVRSLWLCQKSLGTFKEHTRIMIIHAS